MYSYQFGTIRAAAWKGDVDEFNRAVTALRVDRVYRSKHQALAFAADVVVATGMPKILLTVRAAASKIQ